MAQLHTAIDMHLNSFKGQKPRRMVSNLSSFIVLTLCGIVCDAAGAIPRASESNFKVVQECSQWAPYAPPETFENLSRLASVETRGINSGDVRESTVLTGEEAMRPFGELLDLRSRPTLGDSASPKEARERRIKRFQWAWLSQGGLSNPGLLGLDPMRKNGDDSGTSILVLSAILSAVVGAQKAEAMWTRA
ncbi:hypothetical protein FA13DRAFT_1710877 [Coprinellus micaceus]|uniref:Uncharacterized protein n=1 Tax=Coprinellus micaceus TaxID=71717 RepID=A0A4Y7T630_COPMI|nr:hypothetical protein FA13DRAFT_1710877 [Coprinellus micaceus]